MTVVLVHGAWHGAWAWDGVVEALEAAGVTADAPELPFTGFADDVAVAREGSTPLWLSRPVPLHEAVADVDGRLGVDPSRARECFYADADEATAAAAVSRLRTVPGAGDPAVDQPDPAWRRIPSTYVVCRDDRAIDAQVQRTMGRMASLLAGLLP